MDALRERAHASPVCSEIELLGFISDDRKFQLLSECEVLAMPSKREGFPHVVSEAMCCGLPIVTADYIENGTKAIVETFGSGVVTGPGPDAFADGILTALSKWQTYSLGGQSAAQNLGWGAIVERLEPLLLSRAEKM